MEFTPDWKQDNEGLSSNVRGSVLSIPFKGTHAAVIGESNPHSGYARVSLLDAKKDTVYVSLVDLDRKSVV